MDKAFIKRIGDYHKEREEEEVRLKKATAIRALPEPALWHEKELARVVEDIPEGGLRNLAKRLISLQFRAINCHTLVMRLNSGKERKETKDYLMKEFEKERNICLRIVSEFCRRYSVFTPKERLDFYNDFDSWLKLIKTKLKHSLYMGFVDEQKNKERKENARQLSITSNVMTQRTLDFFAEVSRQGKPPPMTEKNLVTSLSLGENFIRPIETKKKRPPVKRLVTKILDLYPELLSKTEKVFVKVNERLKELGYEKAKIKAVRNAITTYKKELSTSKKT